MKLSNFRDHQENARGDRYATVDVETGFLFWKKKASRQIAKSSFTLYWRFVDTGKFTPDFQAETLAAADELKRGIPQ